MKKLVLLSSLLILGTASASHAVIEKDGAKRPHKKFGHHMISRFDQNKDGVITREESRAANDQMFDKIDANKDGQITAEERKAFGEQKRSEFQQRKQAVLEKYDADKDGKLSETERQAFRTEMKSKREAEVPAKN